MAIITVSRELGSLGDDAAKHLAERLGYQLVDKEGLEEALAAYGIEEAKIEKYDEKKPTIWDAFSSDRDRYLHFMKSAIFDHGCRGNAIILGRGAQILLADVPGTLHVRVIAPRRTRLERVAARFEVDENQAEHLIRHSDADRSGYHRFFFSTNWNDPSLYDLVINTKSIEATTVADLIARTLESFDLDSSADDARSVLQDRLLGQRVEARILYEEKIPVQFLEARAVAGTVTLTGAVTSTKNAERAVAIARTVEGVREVESDISFISYYGVM